MPYQEYLQTPEWDEKRRHTLKRYGYRCAMCNGAGQLAVHHRTYERRGYEEEGDLIALCRECHALFHGKPLQPTTEYRRRPIERRQKHRPATPVQEAPQLLDVEAKAVILDKKAIADGIELPDDVRDFLAKQAYADIQDMVGVLWNVHCRGMLTRRPVCMAVAQEVFERRASEAKYKATFILILETVAQNFGVKASDLMISKHSPRAVLLPRQIAMFVVRDLMRISYLDTAHLFDKRLDYDCYGISASSIRKIAKLREADSAFNEQIKKLIWGVMVKVGKFEASA